MAMALVPLVGGGVAAGALVYQSYNPPQKRTDLESDKSLPRNLQDWRLTPQESVRRIPDYWRNHTRPETQPIEDAYRSTYNNIYTNGPKIMRDAITGMPRIITPDGNSTNSVIIDHPGFGQEWMHGGGDQMPEERKKPRQANRTARNSRPTTMPTK
jgi:hypothetical protein